MLRRCKSHGLTTYFYEGREKHPRCKKCRHERLVKLRQERKRKLVIMLGGKCLGCGYDEHPAILDFHHVDRTKKKFAISRGILKAFSKCVEEAKKCILLCCRCHREVELGLRSINTAR